MHVTSCVPSRSSLASREAPRGDGERKSTSIAAQNRAGTIAAPALRGGEVLSSGGYSAAKGATGESASTMRALSTKDVSHGVSNDAVSASRQREADAISLAANANAHTPRASGSAQKNGWPALWGGDDYFPEQWL